MASVIRCDARWYLECVKALHLSTYIISNRLRRLQIKPPNEVNNMDENIKQLMVIAEELEAFKHKVYALLNKEEWLDEFIMNNAPCNYNLIDIVRNIQKGITTHKVKPCQDGEFKGIKCLESEEEYGFFRNQHDVRPSSCIWIKKVYAEKLLEIFKNGGLI